MSRTFHLLTGEYPPDSGGVGDYTQLLAEGLAARGCSVHVWCPTIDPGRAHPVASAVERKDQPVASAFRRKDKQAGSGFLPPKGGSHEAEATHVASAFRRQDKPRGEDEQPVTLSTGAGLLQLHRLPDHFGRASRRTLDAAFKAEPGRVLLQYVPNALGARGANVRFCLWLRHAGRRSDVRVMFHEPYFYFTWTHPLRNGLAVVQRLMAAVLLRTGPTSYVSTDSWHRMLVRWAPRTTRLVTTPVPATVGTSVEADAVARWRVLFTEHGKHAAVIGHFGTYGDHVADELRAAIPAILQAEPTVRIVCLGRRSDAFAESLAAGVPNRLVGTGALSRGDIAAALRACDLLVQPYPDGVTTRRTSVMAGLANGVATVTTSGELTETVWCEQQGVALAEAGDPAALAAIVTRLIHDPVERAALAERGARLYDEAFALERTIDTLLADLPELARA